MLEGVGFSLKKHVLHVRTALLLDEFSDEERRRDVPVTILPGNGLEPFEVVPDLRIRPGQRRSRANGLERKLVNKDFREASACGRKGDFNIDSAYSKAVTDEVVKGTWVDAATTHQIFDGSDPPWTSQKKKSNV